MGMEEIPKFDIEKLRAQARENRERDIAAFGRWLDSIGEERRKKYLALPEISSDEHNSKSERTYLLRRCRFLLEIMHTLRNTEGMGLVPRGLSIHGSDPVVYFREEVDKTRDGQRNFEEMTHQPPLRRGGQDEYFCDIDTTQYGIPATDGGIMRYELDSDEVETRIKWMK